MHEKAPRRESGATRRRTGVSASVAGRRRAVGLRVALAVAVALSALSERAYAADRFALVFGNSQYAAFSMLPNPRNDASDVGAALERLGFEVTTVVDGGRLAMQDALQGFARRSAGASIAVVFYAGHGIEVNGVNYLIPIDARLERDTDVEYETVPLDRVLPATEGALRLVILDASRDNPLTQRVRRARATRSSSMAILELDNLGVDPGLAASVMNLVVSRLANVSYIDLVERGDVQQVLNELKFQNTGITSPRDAVEVGRLLNAQNVVLGNVNQLGSSLTVALRLVETESGRVLGAREILCRRCRPEDLPQEVSLLVGSLVQMN